MKLTSCTGLEILDILAINLPEITQLCLFSFFFLREASILIASSIFFGLVIQKSTTTATLKQQEIEMVAWTLNIIAIH